MIFLNKSLALLISLFSYLTVFGSMDLWVKASEPNGRKVLLVYFASVFLLLFSLMISGKALLDLGVPLLSDS